MSKDSAHLTQVRREEIVSACAKLYETMSFKEISRSCVSSLDCQDLFCRSHDRRVL